MLYQPFYVYHHFPKPWQLLGRAKNPDKIRYEHRQGKYGSSLTSQQGKNWNNKAQLVSWDWLQALKIKMYKSRKK